ncbi:MAG: serine hydrolase [Clostridia bacterium]|nr:serine hydrolase [Clostridia bacterium]
MDLTAFNQKAEQLRAVSLVISQHGRQLAKANWDDDCRRNIYSASKSFTSAAVGIAQREGLLDIGEKLVDAFPDELPAHVSENLRKATVRDCLTMQLGQLEAALMGGQRPYYAERNWVRLSLSLPFTDEPGTRFVYNNVGPYLAGVLIQRRAGCDLVHYLQPRLFDHLGIVAPTWEHDPMGYTFGAGGLFLNVEELHKLGLLYLQEGQWNGRQIIPADWVRESVKTQADNGSFGYGYLFWRGEANSFRADGKYCQWSVVLPEKDAVVSLLAECRDGEALNRALFDDVVSQL